ncbi:UNVERIFIED_CONTAM: hypothetical protein GTU68_034433, partial [Idotea baltica]|nr:hypothetical protein [Idotea baltica]
RTTSSRSPVGWGRTPSTRSAGRTRSTTRRSPIARAPPSSLPHSSSICPRSKPSVCWSRSCSSTASATFSRTTSKCCTFASTSWTASWRSTFRICQVTSTRGRRVPHVREPVVPHALHRQVPPLHGLPLPRHLLLLGMDSVFQVAIALLQMSKKELLSADFEGILKYFRVALPKKYRSEEAARQM